MKPLKQRAYFFTFLMLITVLFVTAFELKLLQSELLIKKMASEEIDYDLFRNLMFKEDILDQAVKRSSVIMKKEPYLKNMPYADEIGYLTFSMMASSYDLTEHSPIDQETFCRGIGELAESPGFKELYGYYAAILKDLICFPVPKVVQGDADVAYADSWGQPRTYGGDRKHEGTDLMASNNLRGYFPIISITDGTVEKMGWLEQGGYRIGIRSVSGGYFYYAHLASYAPELKQGDAVIAGQLLGFMGDSGYGKEGTIGQFDVHLHLGVYVNSPSGEMSVNPFRILKILEKNRTIYSE